VFKKHRIRTEGATARAVVTEAKCEGGYSGRAGTSPVVYHLKLRVQFDDGSVADTACKVGNSFVGSDEFFSTGDIIPVRYDPNDRSQVEVDLAALGAEKEARREKLDAAAIARGEAALAGKNASGAEGESGFADQAAAFRSQAAAFRERTAEPLPSFSAILQAKQSGNQAEIERLKAQLAGRIVQSASSAGDDRLSRLQKLADLHERGALTDQEFAAEKAKILGES
jgi:Short C-terminal domain